MRKIALTTMIMLSAYAFAQTEPTGPSPTKDIQAAMMKLVFMEGNFTMTCVANNIDDGTVRFKHTGTVLNAIMNNRT